MKTLREFTRWLNEEVEGRPKFSIDKLKSISSKKPDNAKVLLEIMAYAESTLGKAPWHGSYRQTWPLDDKRVLKVAKNLEAIGQNEKELNNTQCVGKQFAIEVLEADVNFYWLIEERAKTLSEIEFIQQINKKLGTNFGRRTVIGDRDVNTILMTMSIMTNLITGSNVRGVYAPMYHYFENSTWFQEMSKRVRQCQVESFDFHDGNWGIRQSTGEFILLDLGF